MVLSAVAILFTLIQIQFSFDKYRLAQLPSYDDVSYFCDALSRIDSAQTPDASYIAMLRTFVKRPPHSPFSSVMATAAFLIFGVRDWAPYLMNSLIVLALLGCVDYCMRGTRVWQRVLAGIIVLCIPLAGVMVLDFRPDTAWGLAAAMAVLLPLLSGFIRASWRYHLACGGWFAAALLFKPPMFPLTLTSVIMAWILATICDWIENPAAFSLASAAGAWLVCLLPPLLLALPHYLNDWRNIYEYTFGTALGSGRKAASMSGSLMAQVRFFVDGGGGGFIFYTHIKMILAVLCLGVLYEARRAIRGGRDDRIRLVRIAALGAVAFYTYLTPTVVGLANPFFGAEFQTLMVLGMFIVLRMFLANPDRPRVRLFGNLTLLVCTVLAVRHATFPETWSYRTGSPTVRNNTRVVREVEQILLQHTVPQDWVFLTATGWLNSQTLQYVTRQDGRWLNITDSGSESEDPKAYLHAFASVNIVIAAEPGVDEFNKYRPGLPWDQTLAMIRQSAEFHQIGAVRSGSGKYFYIFQRNVPYPPPPLPSS